VIPPPRAVLAHVTGQAPALSGGAVHYSRLLDGELGQIDFYDSRRHLLAVPGSTLAQRVRSRAGALAQNGLGVGDRVVMVSANTEDYLTTLLAVLLIGAVPCAVAPPPTPARPDSAGVQHLRAALRVVNPAMVLADHRTAIAVDHPVLIEFEDISGGPVWPGPDRATPRPSDPHHIQLTSGSTSAPKAVLLSHRNVAHNIAMIGHAIGARWGRDRVFSWLPMYHDMGFIQVLAALLYGSPIALMTPLGFLRDPLSWPRHMTDHRSTITAGPTFAYRAAADALGRAADTGSGIDLAALRYAYVGAEPITYSTLRDFTDGFAALGLPAEAVVPCYGMAESVLATTLALKTAPQGPGNFGRVRVVATGEGLLVSCGSPIDGMAVSVVDSDGVDVPPGVVGDIRISGASVMTGYQQQDGSVSRPPDGWHDTGDRGFMCDGELFVVGRRKEMLIIRGRNLPPYDVERTIAELPEVGLGQAVVFCVPDEDRDREAVVAVLATAVSDPDQRRQVRAAAANRVREVFGFSLDDVVLVGRTAIPRTTSGKIRRLAVRELYVSDSLS